MNQINTNNNRTMKILATATPRKKKDAPVPLIKKKRLVVTTNGTGHIFQQ